LFDEDIQVRASVYANRRRLQIEQRLGFGKDGSVFQTSLSTAIKVFARRDSYARELACYRRLASHEVEEVHGHVVPRLIASDDELLVIEMEIVAPPFLLDFADAWLDTAPDFPAEVMEQWHEEKSEQFGSQWAAVQVVLAQLRGHYGIHLLDVNPGNITFVEDDGS
jgi:hypothetical protein